MTNRKTRYNRSPKGRERARRYWQTEKGKAARRRNWQTVGHKRRLKKSKRRMYQRRRSLLDTIKNEPCADCGQRFPPYVMDFDHREPSEKEFNIGTCMFRSIERLFREIDKCDIVCANCHRIRTAKRKGSVDDE